MNAPTTIPKELDERRLDELLDIWAKWMREPAGMIMRLEYPSKAAACVSRPWGYWEDTSEELAYRYEYGKADAVNACIDDLSTDQQMAVYHRHLYAVYRFNRANLDDVYAAARQTLRVRLPKRGVY